MTETSDKYADLAKNAGASAGLTQEQIPGLAHILRELARSERAEQKEACARVADDEREWALRRKKENVDEKDRDLEHWYEGEAEASERIAAAIRAME